MEPGIALKTLCVCLRLHRITVVYCGRVKSTCLGAGRWQVAERKVVEEADGKWENTEECINREPFSASRSSIILQAVTYRFYLFCFVRPRFPLLVLARPATDHSAHTPTTTLFQYRSNLRRRYEGYSRKYTYLSKSNPQFVSLTEKYLF